MTPVSAAPASRRRSMNYHRSPSFIMVGPLRAGTTMLRLLMAHHPRISCVGEFEEPVSQIKNCWPDVEWYRKLLAQDRAAIAKRYELHPAIDDYPTLVRSMWDQLAARQSKSIVGCTIHSRFDKAHELWPEAKLIFIVRDPRDVARSCVGMGWAGEPTHAVDYWLEPVRRWCELRRSLARESYVEVRYEDLLRQPESVLDRCCRLLGERFDPAMLDYHRNSTYEPLDPSLAEQWRRKLPPRLAEIIDSRCADFMGRFGYTASVSQPRPASRLERWRLLIENRIGRFSFRLRRYGLRRVIRWYLWKRLAIDHPRRRRIRAELNEIDREHLK